MAAILKLCDETSGIYYGLRIHWLLMEQKPAPGSNITSIKGEVVKYMLLMNGVNTRFLIACNKQNLQRVKTIEFFCLAWICQCFVG